jgi:hypothetical protein
MKNAKECEPSGSDANRTHASNMSAKPDTKLPIAELTKSYALYVRSCLPMIRDSLLVPFSTIKRVSKFESKLYFVYIFMSVSSGFCGLEASCWPLAHKFVGSHPAKAVGFLRRKIPQHPFLRRESKAVGPMS